MALNDIYRVFLFLKVILSCNKSFYAKRKRIEWCFVLMYVVFFDNIIYPSSCSLHPMLRQSCYELAPSQIEVACLELSIWWHIAKNLCSPITPISNYITLVCHRHFFMGDNLESNSTLVEKSIEISIGFLHRKLAYELHRNFMELHRTQWRILMELHRISMELHKSIFYGIFL
jgi:hypothetical protein